MQETLQPSRVDQSAGTSSLARCVFRVVRWVYRHGRDVARGRGRKPQWLGHRIGVGYCSNADAQMRAVFFRCFRLDSMLKPFPGGTLRVIPSLKYMLRILRLE